MPWPLASHISAILQDPRIAFRDPLFQAYHIERNALNQPRVWSGQFAVVYKGVDANGKSWAIRAFTSESRDRRNHYDQISAHLKAHRLRCLVDFEYRDASIRSTDGKWYPLVVMDWVEGMTLFNWVDSKCKVGKGASIAKAVQHWVNLVNEMADAEIAHCDLSQVNVLVTPDGYLKLVDYDGMCVPALAGRQNLEMGVRPYQHPRRNEQTLLSANLDNFSALLIYVALRALAADTSLWTRHVAQSGYDKLLFRSEDFADCEQSALYHDLMKSPDPGVRDLAGKLFAMAKGNMDDVPPLGKLVGLQTSPVAKAWGVERSSPSEGSGPQVEKPGFCEKPGFWDRSTPESAAASDRPTAQVVLHVVSSPIDRDKFVIDQQGTVLVGRGDDCQLRIIDDPRVSRHHFSLQVNPPHIHLRDLGGRNGTFVNGVQCSARSQSRKTDDGDVPAAEVELRHGDRIMIGRTIIEVHTDGKSG
ncbi:MAG: FHA domain-containing protein [Planctomycetes bacterium]|nr:FHA domain-containing protein [Planctomycetota bacterium]